MNPLLSRDYRIPFDAIGAEHVLPAVSAAVERSRREMEELAAPLAGGRTYDNTVAAFDAALERLDRVVGIAYHLNSVSNTPPMREAFNAALPIFSEFYAKLPTDQGLWRAFSAFAASEAAADLEPVRARRLEKLLRDFRRAGAELEDAARSRVEAIRMELERLESAFSDNVLDATNAFELVLGEEADLAGLPDSARRLAADSARSKGLQGWRFTLHLPSYQPFMQYAERRELRRRMYEAYHGRACGGGIDNRPVIRRILALRRELAGLLGYRDFADYRLETSMVKSGAAAVAFENELYQRTLPYWRAEIHELERFAAAELGIDCLEPWDVAFATERLRLARFRLDAEELRPYFPLDSVLAGLFEIARRLFGITVDEVENAALWHPDVRYFEVRDEDGLHLGSFYADLFPRESKRAGAWMNALITGGPAEAGGFEPHLALMAANFSPPGEDRPALLTHREVQTTFHEFGHLLHHLLSTVPERALGGTRVPRDWVELPSQLMENWTWQEEAQRLFARHFETQEPLPDDLRRKLEASRRFMEATAQMRQLSFGTADLALHVDYDGSDQVDPVEFGSRVMERFVPRPEFAHNGLLCHFTHLFATGYAAAYYSYKWCQALEADAFSRFERSGVFDRGTGEELRRAILARGDSRDPADMFRDFMGRDPDLGALIRRNLGELPDAHRPATS